MSLSDLKKLIREELGRNLRSTSNDPLNYEDMGYEIEIIGSLDEGYFLNVHYMGTQIHSMSRFNDRSEAQHFAIKVIERDKLERMNKN